MISMEDQGDEVVIYAAEFFSKKLTANVFTKKGLALKCSKEIDTGLAFFMARNLDINDDGKEELLVTTHEGSKDKADVIAYELPTDLCNGAYTKHILATNAFVTKKTIMPGSASPGFAYPFVPKAGERTQIFIEGDGSHEVYLLRPTGDKGAFDFDLQTIGDVGGTTGGCALADFDGDSIVEAVCANNDKSLLQLIRFAEAAEETVVV